METIPQSIDVESSRLYKLAPGPWATRVVSHAIRDDARDKEIPLRITWPREGGPFPVLVFCHGALGSRESAQPLASHWASHGYVVLQPTFGDSISLLTPEERAEAGSLVALVNSPRIRQQWDDRPMDVKRVLDALEAIEGEVDGLAGKVDGSRIGIAGHSFGAQTCMLLGGATVGKGYLKRFENLEDDRPRAIIAISPQGIGGIFEATSFAGLTRPTLMITGDNDGSPMQSQRGRAGTWRREAFAHAPAGERYLMWIRDAWHGFGGINGFSTWPGAGPRSIDQVMLVRSTCLAFFDAFVKDDEAARAYLDADTIRQETDGTAWLEQRQPDQ